MEKLQVHPHRRYNVLTGEWVLVSPHRTARPWQGAHSKTAATPAQAYDPECYLCPGNTRANGERNPQYEQPYAFTNDYSALYRHNEPFEYNDALFVARSEEGVCRVICYAPQHNTHFTDFSPQQITQIIDLWDEEYTQVAQDSHIAHVQIFENRGQQMGASNPHPHGQIWAQTSTPHIAARKVQQQAAYYQRHNGNWLLLDYARREQEQRTRLLYANRDFVWLVPFWACWPFETLILPAARAMRNIKDMDSAERLSLATILQVAIGSYDHVFKTPFPYSMALHLPPTGSEQGSMTERETQAASTHTDEGWQFHIGFYPPLLRSATVRKFMVGYELCAMPQRDITPEKAAEQLRSACQHYQNDGALKMDTAHD